ncbi:MAG: hypothetical protein GXN94_01795 [Aquificae bacterium]|nr:hypothetical protein [Aquificota bacterium]
MNYDRFSDLITKVWFYLLIAVGIVVSISVSLILFVALLVIVLITVPYLWYLRWKTEKSLEDRDLRRKIRKQLKDL